MANGERTAPFPRQRAAQNHVETGLDYHFNFSYIWRHFDRLWGGLILSLELAFISILIGMLIGLVLALVYTGGGRVSRALVAAYV
jgi:polar amino acid transport system permease protein